jgi:hypothetical protein
LLKKGNDLKMKKTIEELMNSIEYNNGTFPKDEIKELIERKEETSTISN